jgi:hypothetical protein
VGGLAGTACRAPTARRITPTFVLPHRGGGERLAKHAESGFTLAEVLVATVVLLMGVFAALNLFPPGLDAIEFNRKRTVAARLAELELERWKLRRDSVPLAISLVRGGSLYALECGVIFDPESLTPNEDNPAWLPDSVHQVRTVIGEPVVLPSDATDVQTASGGRARIIQLPMVRLAFTPVAHLFDPPFDSPGSGDYREPFIIYTTAYKRVDSVDLLAQAPSSADREQYYIDYSSGTVSFDHVAEYERWFRVEYSWLDKRGPTGPLVQRQWIELVGVAPGEDTVRHPKQLAAPEPFEDENENGRWDEAEPFTDTNCDGRWEAGEPFQDKNGNGRWDDAEPFTDFNGNGRRDGREGFQGVVWGSERVHRAFKRMESAAELTAPGSYFVDKGALYSGRSDLSLSFPAEEAGKRVLIDYRVRDWQILREEKTVPDDGKVKLLFSHIRPDDFTIGARIPTPQPVDPDVGAAVIALDLESGSRLVGHPGPPDASHVQVNYLTGTLTFDPSAIGRTYRIHYRAIDDWTVQVSKAASEYSQSFSRAPGFRSFVWDGLGPRVFFSPADAGSEVAVDYWVQPAGGARSPVTGEVFRLSTPANLATPQEGSSIWLRLPSGTQVAPGMPLRIRGVSLRVRVLWTGRGNAETVQGERIAERWRRHQADFYVPPGAI